VVIAVSLNQNNIQNIDYQMTSPRTADEWPIKILALDLDGTLVTENNQVSSGTRNALEELRQQQVEVVISTGRRYRTTRYVIDNLGWPTIAVCNGGALVKGSDERTLHRDCFPDNDFKKLISLARDTGQTFFAQRDSHELGGADFVMDAGLKWNDQAAYYYELNKSWCCKDEDFADSSTGDYLVLGCFGDHDSLFQFSRDVAEKFTDKYATTIVPHVSGIADSYYCELTLSQTSKWSGLLALAKLMEVDHRCICAVGDQLNDMSMIKSARVGIAMANAPVELQREADWVCGHHMEDGLLDVVNFVLEHNQSLPAVHH
jgi:Cof subfamily protein (haloacid dehalogenase superfamily)